MKKSKLQLVLAGVFGLGAISCLVQFQLVSAIVGAVVAYFIYKHEPKEKQPKQKKAKQPKQKKLNKFEQAVIEEIVKEKEAGLKAIQDEIEALESEPLFEDECFKDEYIFERMVKSANGEYWLNAESKEVDEAIYKIKCIYHDANEIAKEVSMEESISVMDDALEEERKVILK